MKGHRQTTDGVGYETEYAYNLSGAMVEQRYPSGRVVKNVLDASGDLSMVQSARCMDAAAGTEADCTAQAGLWNYAKNFTYNPAGAVTSMQLGNGRWESTVFNSRLQPTQITLGATRNATNLLKLDYSYGTTANNGNVLSQTITVPTVGINTGFSAVQTYNYDSLNRLKDATEMLTPTGGSATQSWKQTFVFDRYGNRNFDEANTAFAGFDKLCNNNTELCADLRKRLNPSINTSNNRLSTSDDYDFDESGNTTEDPDGRTFVYDAENKQVSVSDTNGTIGEYVYDGDGKRVKKHVPSTGEVTVFVYDAAGKLVAEYSTIVASTNDATVAYLTNDHLSSPRITTDQFGQIASRRDFMPYGEEIARTAHGSDTIHQKFTGYERDIESELDFAEARYYSSAHGRFTSTDPILIKKDRLVDPQRLNLYVYVRNSPYKFVDTTGEDLVLANAAARTTFRQVTTNGLTRAERNNIRVLTNGRVVLRNPNAVNVQNASYAYQQIAGIVSNRNLTINVYSVAQGQTVQGVSYQYAYDSAGVTLGEAGDPTRDVVIPVGGGVPVCANPPGSCGNTLGSGNTVATTEDTIFAHEVFGHANGNDGDDSITAENNYRRSRNPAIGERSGDDHRYVGPEVTAPAQLITTTPAQVQTTISPRPLISLPTPPSPLKKPEELDD